MVVDSQQPHFVGVDPDILSTGLVFYYVKVCKCFFAGTSLLLTCCDKCNFLGWFYEYWQSWEWRAILYQ